MKKTWVLKRWYFIISSNDLKLYATRKVSYKTLLIKKKQMPPTLSEPGIKKVNQLPIPRLLFMLYFSIMSRMVISTHIFQIGYQEKCQMVKFHLYLIWLIYLHLLKITEKRQVSDLIKLLSDGLVVILHLILSLLKTISLNWFKIMIRLYFYSWVLNLLLVTLM